MPNQSLLPARSSSDTIPEELFVEGAAHLGAPFTSMPADLSCKQGACSQAESLYQRALAILDVSVGPDHPDSARILQRLAQLSRQQGQEEHAPVPPTCVRAV